MKKQKMSVFTYISRIFFFVPICLWRYFVWHIAFIDNAYRKNIWRFNGNVFCFLFNFRAFVRRKPIRFSFDPTTLFYRADSDGYFRYFHSKFANLIDYSNGIEQRGNDLGTVYFLPQIEFSAGDRVVDCGANVGDLKLYFDINDIDVEYIGIEPSPLEYECLASNVQPCKIYNMGLWSEEGELVFYVSSHNADSSFIKPSQYTHVCKVPTNRLDKLISGRVKLLKVEAEGAEPEVLEGCESLLPNIEYISADLGFERGVDCESTLPQTVNYLFEQGFELVEIGYPRLIALFHNKAFKN